METKIITIEGIDGSGKTVQFDLLKRNLEAAGYTVSTLSFPDYESFFGKQVGRYLSGEEGVAATDVDQKSMALWFALDRWETFKNRDDEECDFLIINRYVLSNAVYQSIRDRDLGRPDLIDWVFELEYGHFGLPRPSLNLFFDVSTDRAGMNVDRKGFRDYVGEGRDVYESCLGIQERARNMYIRAAGRYGDVEIIPCMEGRLMRSPEDIASDVMDAIEKRGLLNRTPEKE